MDILGIGRAHRGSADTPVAVLSRTFPVDTTLSDLWAFLRDSLGQASLTGDELMAVDATVARALANVDDGIEAVTVSLRVFSHSIEVDVLASDQSPDTGDDTRVTYGTRHVSYHYRRRDR